MTPKINRGTAINGTRAKGPPIRYITPIKINTKGKSIKPKIVAEPIKSL